MQPKQTTETARVRESSDNKTGRTVLPIFPLNRLRYAQQLLDCSATTIYQHLAHKRLRAKKSGKLTMITGESIVELIAELPEFKPGKHRLSAHDGPDAA
jgi:hypothetical protein